MAIESINPATGKLLRSFQPLGMDVVRGKLQLAAQAFAGYGEQEMSEAGSKITGRVDGIAASCAERQAD